MSLPSVLRLSWFDVRKLSASLAVAALLASCSHSASVASPTPPTPASHIAARISIRESRAIFELFAMLNVAGYDVENRPLGMHSARARVRQAMMALLPDSVRDRLHRYYASRLPAATPWHYAVVVLSTSGPPEYVPGKSWAEIVGMEQFKSLADLPSILRDLHRRYAIDSLYAAVQPEYRVQNSAYDAAVRREVESALLYARIMSPGQLRGFGEHGPSVIYPNLLQSFENAFSMELDSTFISVEGPQQMVGYNPHEFIHAITNPLSYDPHFASLQQRATAMLLAARASGSSNAFARTALSAFLDENLVRAIVLRYDVQSRPDRDSARFALAIADARDGNLLVPFFYEQLHRYERSGRPLAEEYARMLEALDAASEMDRLRSWGVQFKR